MELQSGNLQIVENGENLKKKKEDRSRLTLRHKTVSINMFHSGTYKHKLLHCQLTGI